MVPIWLPWFEKEHGVLPPPVRQQLTAMSARTLDRLLQPVRQMHGTRGRCGTRPGSLLKHQIPIKTEHADVHQPGVLEADTVAHCGNSLAGDFIWSLTLTDIFSGWTENRAVWNKGYEGVRHAIADVEQHLPFALTGFHSDNGGEFLNHHLIRFFQERHLPVDYSRGRPYHKNDTAHVEQKNYTHVRLLLGYERLSDPALLDPINLLYETWALFNNFFCASLKLVCKTKQGSRYHKTYDIPKTPYQRLMESPAVNEAIKTHLTELACNLNPFVLKKQIDARQRRILR
jgi:transposase InsO family protein